MIKELKTKIRNLLKRFFGKPDLISEIRNAIVDMMRKVDFDEVEHRYTRKLDGKWLAGVSSISELMPKPYLMPWAAKMAVEYLQDKQDTIKELNNKDYLFLLDEAKGAYRRKSGEAMEIGTNGHDYLESWVLSKIRGTEEPILEDESLERPISEFKKWANENIKEWILAEARISDIKEEFAGTLDAVAITKEGKLAVIDFKFANQISSSYHIQTAGYAIPFEKYGIKIEDRIVVRLPKTLTKKVYNKDTRQYDEVENNIEIGRSPFSMSFDKETFRHARALYRYTNAIEK